jgi:hypothetical protein
MKISYGNVVLSAIAAIIATVVIYEAVLFCGAGARVAIAVVGIVAFAVMAAAFVTSHVMSDVGIRAVPAYDAAVAACVSVGVISIQDTALAIVYAVIAAAAGAGISNDIGKKAGIKTRWLYPVFVLETLAIAGALNAGRLGIAFAGVAVLAVLGYFGRTRALRAT